MSLVHGSSQSAPTELCTVHCVDIISVNGLPPALQEHTTEGLRQKKEQDLSENDVFDLKTAPRAKDRA